MVLVIRLTKIEVKDLFFALELSMLANYEVVLRYSQLEAERPNSRNELAIDSDHLQILIVR